MICLTQTQQKVLKYILSRWDAGEALPSCREIMSHFGWASPKAASDVLNILKRKGFVASDRQSTRKYRLTEQTFGLPVLGEIPAGLPIDSVETQGEHFTFRLASFGVRDRSLAFFLRVKGDSMIGRHIFDGDLVLVDKSMHPGHRSVVAALIDNAVTLKTLIQENGKAWLKSENPEYPDIFPLQNLQIQGIARGVIRPLKS
jgi:repressor LexA